MKGIGGKKEQAGNELEQLRQRIAELEKAETERRHADEIIRKSEAKFRSFFEYGLMGVAITSPEKGWMEVNDHLCKLLGYSREELVTKTWDDMTYPDDLAPDVEQFNRILGREIDSYSMEKRFIRKDGGIIFTITSVSGIRRQNGSVDYFATFIQDITERKRAEEELKETKSKLQGLIYSIPDIVLFKDVKYRYLLVNKAVEDTTGLTNEKMFGKTDEVLFPHDMAEMCRKSDEEAIRSSGPTHFEECGIGKNGEKIFLDTIKAPIHDSQGNLMGLVIVSRDITERKKAEEELLKFKLGIERSDDAIFMTDIDGKIIYINPSFEKTYGYRSEESLGKQPNILKSGLLPPEVYKSFWDTLLAKKVVRGELINKTRDGRLINIDGSANPILNNNGSIIGFLAIQRDITERKRVEEAIVKSETKYRMLFEAAGDYILVISLRDIDCPVIIDANNAAMQYHGYSREEMIGKAIKEVVAPGHFEKNIEIVKRQIQKPGDSCIFETVHVRKDGSTFPVEVSARMLQIGDEPPLFFTIERDITEHKKAEEISRENERLVYASNAKNDFLSNMSHELRTPLNAIIGFSDLLKMKTLGNLTEKQESYVDNIRYGGRHLLNIISDILDLSKIEAGKMDMVFEKISVLEIIDETLVMVEEMAKKNRVTIQKEFDPQLEFIEADKQRFIQILFNLMSNAVKFSKKEGGLVTVTTKKEGDNAKFSISDTGIGIREEDKNRLFKDFEQLDSGTNRKYAGTGLGLAITKKLVELHGGRIRFESEFGAGSTFSFLLPIDGNKAEIIRLEEPLKANH